MKESKNLLIESKKKLGESIDEFYQSPINQKSEKAKKVIELKKIVFNLEIKIWEFNIID